MDPIELMAIKPLQIKNALGADCVKIVRGSRLVYNRRQSRSRRGLNSDDKHDREDKNDETRPIWICTDTVCGGKSRRRRPEDIPAEDEKEEPDQTAERGVGVTQTDPIDLTYYGSTAEELQRDNVTILNAYPRDIQDGVVRGRKNSDKRLSIDQWGSSGEIGSQVNMEKEKPKQPKGNFLRRKLQALSNFFKRKPVVEASDSESSWSTSDSEISENDAERERDHEWLEHTSTEQSHDDMQEAFELDQIENPPAQTRIELQCFELMSSIKPFFWFLKCGGRWPLQTYVEDRLFKFRLNRFAPNFILFVLTTLFLLVCTSQVLFNIIILLRGHRAGGYQTQVQKVLFNKYWPYTFVTLLYSMYASIWSLGTIFDDGVFLAQFMSRWNFRTSVINYDPCEYVRWDMWWSLGWLIFYFVSLSIFYIWDMIPAVRGTSELLGMFLLNGFVSDLNLSKYFFLVRIYGFLFHLYAVFSARVITIWVLLYCKFLENLARRWNIRFCYVFKMLGSYEGPNTYIIYHTVIPFTKLFTEHKLITAISRYTGKIFTVALSSYFLLKGLEMIILAYSSMCLLVFPSPKLNETALPCPYQMWDCTPVPYRDEDVFTVMTLFYFTGQSWLGWYLTSDSISACGQAIMSGWVFVRRMGFPRCSNSKERRFIQSLNFTYSPITDYYIKAGFKVNRKFIHEMFSWVFIFTSLIVLFSPFHLRTEVVTYCGSPVNGTTTCYRTTIPKATLYNLMDSDSELKNELPIKIETKTTTSTTTTAPTTITTLKTTTTTPTTTTTTTTTTPSTTTTTPSTTTTKPTTTTTTPTTTTTTPTTTTTKPTTTTTTPTTTTTTTTATTTTPKTTTTTSPSESCTKFGDAMKTDWDCDYYECKRTDGVHTENIRIPVMCDKNGHLVPPYNAKSGAKWVERICYKTGITADTVPYDYEKRRAPPDPDLYSCSTKVPYMPKRFDRAVRDDCGNLPFHPKPGNRPSLYLVGMPTKYPYYAPCYFCFRYPWLLDYPRVIGLCLFVCSFPLIRVVSLANFIRKSQGLLWRRFVYGFYL